jgi:tetratricopeptide (TPR) repeat protein
MKIPGVAVRGIQLQSSATMSADEALQRARDAFSRRDWLAARDAFVAAAAIDPLAADDVYLLGDAVWWLGEFSRAASLYEDAYALYVREDRPGSAALCALAIAGFAFMRGQPAYGSGWVARAARLLEELPPGAEHGYLLFTELSGTLSDDLVKAARLARELQSTGRKFGDANLVGLGVLSEGLALVKQGSINDGLRLLDEAMLAAVSDELAPEWAGYIYCQLMAACHELGDLERAREWTRATERWCDGLQSAGPFLGVCRVHRAQIFQTQGAWQQAEIEAARACEQLAGFDTGNVGEGHYRIGELRRLRGDFAGAERSFREAHALGRDPQPGLALLRLAQGRVDEARTSIQTSLATGPSEMLHRAWLCVACVEVSLAAGATQAARTACDELRSAAAAFGSSVLRAAAEQAHGAVLLAEGDPRGALGSLRSACLSWQQLDAPTTSLALAPSLLPHTKPSPTTAPPPSRSTPRSRSSAAWAPCRTSRPCDSGAVPRPLPTA